MTGITTNCLFFPFTYTQTFSLLFVSLQPTYSVHPQEDAWPSSGVAIMRVLQARAVPQPGPLELTCFPLRALLQIILYEVFLLCAEHVLPLLSAVVVRWKRTATTEHGRRMSKEESINKLWLQALRCQAQASD